MATERKVPLLPDDYVPGSAPDGYSLVKQGDRWVPSPAPSGAGAYMVISETEPTETTVNGQPVIWFKGTTYNIIPEVSIEALSAVDLAVELAFTGSDADGDALTYTVDWGDGTTIPNATSPATHTYEAEGTYTVQVTVSDGLADATDNATIHVAAPVAARWAFDSFSYPDGTVISGWAGTSTKEPALTTEEGGYTWEPGDESTGKPIAASDNTIYGGKFRRPPGDTSHQSASLHDLPSSSYRVALDYWLTDAGEEYASQDRVEVFVACSPASSQSQTGTTSCSIALVNTGVGVWSMSSGSYTSLASYVAAPNSGRLVVAYDATTGQVTVTIDGVQYHQVTYPGAAYPKVGFRTRRASAVDNFQVGPL